MSTFIIWAAKNGPPVIRHRVNGDYMTVDYGGMLHIIKGSERAFTIAKDAWCFAYSGTPADLNVRSSAEDGDRWRWTADIPGTTYVIDDSGNVLIPSPRKPDFICAASYFDWTGCDSSICASS